MKGVKILEMVNRVVVVGVESLAQCDPELITLNILGCLK